MLDQLFGALLAQAADAATTVATKSAIPEWLPMVGLLLVSTVPAYLLGLYLAKALRVPEYANSVAFILLSIGLGVGVLVAATPQVGLATPKFGIDLKGGVILVYEIDKDDTAAANAESGEQGSVSVEDLVAALNERLNPGGINEIQIRAYGANQVEIVVPDVGPEEVAAIKRQVENAGKLEFLILATDPDVDDAINLVLNDTSLNRDKLVRNAEGQLVGKWARVSWEINKKTKQRQLSAFSSSGTFRNAATGELLLEARSMSQPQFEAFLKDKDIEHIDALMVVDPDSKNRVEGTDLAQATLGNNQFGDPIVNFVMSSTGAARMANLTGNNISDRQTGRMRFLGIVLDGNLRSAPSVNDTISDRGQISGGFTRAEVDDLVKVLRSGRLPAVLQREPISENQINPLLGQDTINKGKFSIMVSVIAVLVFMVIYYRFAGAVACFALTVNTILVVSFMILMKAAFTLPGLAGMVLTVGMSVDANVLIYERIREELAKGSALRLAIRNGFSRAMSSIIDGNVTTIITAVVLYVIGTEQLKGFAVTLILGIMMSMYTAIFCSRVIFEIAERRRFIKTLNMMDWWGKSNIDFIRMYVPTTALSVLVIVIGLVATVARGKTLFDIDFTGGTSVEMLLREPLTETEVRSRLTKLFAADKVDFNVTAINSVENLKDGSIYKIDTSLGEVTELEAKLEEAFKDQDGQSLLAINKVEVAKVEPAEPFGPVKKPAAPAADAGETKQPETKVEEQKKNDVKPTEEPKPEEKKADDKKADEPKVDEPKVEEKAEEKKVEEPKADEPKVEEKADEKKADETPAEEKKTDETEKAKAGDSARRLDVPADLIALAQDADAAAKQDETPAEKKQDEPAESPPATETKGDKTKADEKKADEESPEKKNEQSPAASTPAEPAAPTTPAVTAPAVAIPDAYSQIEMGFEYDINADTLHMVVSDAVKALDEQGKLDRKVWDTETARPGWIQLAPVSAPVDWTRDSSKKFDRWTIKLASTTKDAEQIAQWVETHLEDATVWQSSSKIGGKVAGKTRDQAIWAIVASLIGIIAYVWVRFHKLAYGVAAVVALVHDVLVTVGFIAISAWLIPALGFLQIEEFKISLTVIAAILTLIGYSLNDTIVTFDRMREIKGKSPVLTAAMINRSINETLSRTFLTAGTTLIVVVILYFMGGAGIHGFAFTMLIGVIAGTYSSVFIAAPLLLWMGGTDPSDVNAKNSPTEKVKAG